MVQVNQLSRVGLPLLAVLLTLTACAPTLPPPAEPGGASPAAPPASDVAPEQAAVPAGDVYERISRECYPEGSVFVGELKKLAEEGGIDIGLMDDFPAEWSNAAPLPDIHDRPICYQLGKPGKSLPSAYWVYVADETEGLAVARAWFADARARGFEQGLTTTPIDQSTMDDFTTDSLVIPGTNSGIFVDSQRTGFMLQYQYLPSP